MKESNSLLVQAPPLDLTVLRGRPRPFLVRADQTVRIPHGDQQRRVVEIAHRHADEQHASCGADKIVLGEPTGVPTFLGALLPLLRIGAVKDAHVVFSEGEGGVGFLRLHRYLMTASGVTHNTGIALRDEDARPGRRAPRLLPGADGPGSAVEPQSRAPAAMVMRFGSPVRRP